MPLLRPGRSCWDTNGGCYSVLHAWIGRVTFSTELLLPTHKHKQTNKQTQTDTDTETQRDTKFVTKIQRPPKLVHTTYSPKWFRFVFGPFVKPWAPHIQTKSDILVINIVILVPQSLLGKTPFSWCPALHLGIASLGAGGSKRLPGWFGALIHCHSGDFANFLKSVPEFPARPQSARLSAGGVRGGGPITIGAMPKCRRHQLKRVCPYHRHRHYPGTGLHGMAMGQGVSSVLTSIHSPTQASTPTYNPWY